MNDICANCFTALTEVEQKAKDDEKADEWNCYECFDDDNYTEHGKYLILLNYLKHRAYLHYNLQDMEKLKKTRPVAYHQIQEAREILDKIRDIKTS